MAKQKINYQQSSGTTLAYVESSSSFSTTSTTYVQVTSMTATVTIPTLTGNQRVEIEYYTRDAWTQGGGIMDVSIWDGTVGSGTQLQEAEPSTPSGSAVPLLFKYSGTPSAGSHTFNIGLKKAASPTTAWLECTSAGKMWMSVKVV